MADARERLAGHLHSGFDLDPEGVIALRINHPGGLLWQISDDVLTVWIGEAEGVSFDLGVSINALTLSLTAAGVQVAYVNGDVSGRSAGCLVSGRGGGANDRLVAYQSNLWALLDAYGVEIRGAEVNLSGALEQLQMSTSEGEFLDFWGEFFAVPRLAGEGDPAYYERMKSEVLRFRNNAFAIQKTVRDLTGAIVSLREPWKEIFTLDVSALSDRHAFQDGTFFTWNVFQPVFHSALSPAERARVLEIIERNRPAGCLMVGATSQPPIAYANAHLAPQGQIKLTAIFNFGISHYQSGHLSSSLALSDILQDVGSVFKWTLSGQVRLTFGADPFGLIYNSTWDDRGWGGFSWIKPSICMVVTRTSV
jgi:hypothetical protein